MRLYLITVLSAVFAILLVPIAQANAQLVLASTAFGVTPSNTSQCPTSGYGTVTGVYNTGTIQSGFCQIPITWNNGVSFPSGAYAVTCTVQAGGPLGYLYNPQILAATQTATGVTVSINFWVDNVEISNDGNVPSGAIDLGHPSSGEQDWYVFAEPAGGGRRAPIGIQELPTMYVYCMAMNA